MNEHLEERICIKMESGISEEDAIKQAITENLFDMLGCEFELLSYEVINDTKNSK